MSKWDVVSAKSIMDQSDGQGYEGHQNLEHKYPFRMSQLSGQFSRYVALDQPAEEK